jgi:hypothetical protein
MNPTTARFLFDECLGKPIVEPLARLISMGKGEKPGVAHILDFTGMGTRDEDWIPRIARDGWTVITQDGGRTPNKLRGKKLPRLCAEYAVTHVILSPAICQRYAFEKFLTVLSVWYQLIDMADDPANRGNRYALEPAYSGMRGHGRLISRAIPPDLLAIRDQYLRSEKSPGSGTQDQS